MMEYSRKQLLAGDFSNTEYLNMSRSQQRLVWYGMLDRAATEPAKQMTNKQILRKFFTRSGRLKGKYNV